MEPPAESTTPATRGKLAWALIAVSLAIHLWLILSTQVTSRDSLGFARAALQFDDPNAGRAPGEAARTRLDVLREAEHPPGYPIAVWLMSFPVRTLYHVSLGEQFIRSAQIVNLFASVLLALVLFRLGCELFSTRVGFVSAVLFQALPVAARTTSDGLSEGLFLLAVGCSLRFGVRAIRDQRRSDYLNCGLLAAASYLVRPEGMLAALVVGLALVSLWFSRQVALRPMLIRGAILSLGVMLLATPYMAAVGGVTNKPTGRKLLRWMIGAPQEPAIATKAMPSSPLLFAAWYVPGEDGPKPLWIATTFAKETTKTFHYVPAFFAIIGILMVLRTQWQSKPAVRVLVFYLFAHSTLIVVMALSSGYLSERHTLPLVFVGSLFAAHGLSVFADGLAVRRQWQPRTTTAVLSGLLVLACLPPLLRSRHDERLGHVLAGRWLAEHVGAKDAIVDPFDWAQFYSGRTLYCVAADPSPATGFYAVMEEGKSSAPRSKLPRHWYAEALAKKGRPVYQWPTHEGERGTKVVVYRVDVAEH